MMCTNEKTVEPRVHYAPLMTGRTLCPVIDANRKTGDIEQATCPECRELYFQDITFGECVPYRQEELKQALKGGRIESFSVLANKWKRLPAWVDGETIELLGNLRYRIAVREREEPTKCEHCDGLLVRPTRVKGFRIGTCEDCGVGGLHVCNDYNLCHNCFDNQLCDDLVYEEAGACQKPTDKVTPQPQEAAEESNKSTCPKCGNPHMQRYHESNGLTGIVCPNCTWQIPDVAELASQAAQIEELTKELDTLKAENEKLKALLPELDFEKYSYELTGKQKWLKLKSEEEEFMHADLIRTLKQQPEPEYLTREEPVTLEDVVFQLIKYIELYASIPVKVPQIISDFNEEYENRERADLNKLTKEKEG